MIHRFRLTCSRASRCFLEFSQAFCEAKAWRRNRNTVCSFRQACVVLLLKTIEMLKSYLWHFLQAKRLRDKTNILSSEALHQFCVYLFFFSVISLKTNSGPRLMSQWCDCCCNKNTSLAVLGRSTKILRHKKKHYKHHNNNNNLNTKTKQWLPVKLSDYF